jgi:hypothetical protein
MGKLKHSGRLFKEIWQFAMENKAYWIIPLVLVFVLIAVLVATSQTAAPFVYTLF